MNSNLKTTLAKGDKIKMVKNLNGFLFSKGEELEVLEVYEDGFIRFKSGIGTGIISVDMFVNYFEKIEPKKDIMNNSMDKKSINEILDNSEIKVYTLFEKCTVVACKLPNGFVVIESSSCCNPKDYDKEMGINICMKRIKNKVLEMEAYKMQSNIFDYCSKMKCKDDCDNCPCEINNSGECP